MKVRERNEEMARFIRLISRLTRQDECQACGESGLDANPACVDHRPWDMSAADASETIDSLVVQARRLVAGLAL